MVARTDDGKLVVKDQVGDVDYVGTVSGGTLGLLIGLLGGPLGVLIGGTYGLMVGSLFDLGEADETESVLSQIATSVRPGHTALPGSGHRAEPGGHGHGHDRARRHGAAPPGGRRGGRDGGRREGPARSDARGEQGAMRGRREHTKEQAQAKVQDLKAKLHGEKTATAGS